MWQRMSDAPEAACPACGAAARRLFFPAGIVFKGTGFYATDNRSKSRSGDTSKPSGGATEKKSSTTPTTSGDSASTPATTS